MANHSETESARMFFALWPDGRTRTALDQAAGKVLRQCGGRRTRRETIHMTLVFLGDVPLSRLEQLRVAATGITLPAFSVPINRLGWWKHNQILWAGTDAVPELLSELSGQLRERLTAAGFSFDTKAFVPHVTLLRKAQCPDREFPPLAAEWKVGSFVLVRSAQSALGAAYEIVGRWELLKEK